MYITGKYHWLNLLLLSEKSFQLRSLYYFVDVKSNNDLRLHFYQYSYKRIELDLVMCLRWSRLIY
jgi:hypothetical protein